MGIRVGARKVGCSCYTTYTFDYVNETSANDNVVESHDITLAINPGSVLLIDGSQADFVKQGFTETLKFDNSYAESECGFPAMPLLRQQAAPALCKQIKYQTIFFKI